MFASLFHPSPTDDGALAALAADFSPRMQWHGANVVSIDVSGLDRLLGTPLHIGEALAREARVRRLQVQIGVAATETAARLVAYARPGLTVVPAGGEWRALAPLSIEVLRRAGSDAPIDTWKRWGLRTLGQLAALPADELTSRLGPEALRWHAMARGCDAQPLVPAREEERFEASLALEWPIDDLEPLSFVLTRLLEPISTRLERRDRGAAAITTTLRLVTRETTVRRLELPTPLTGVRALRTLVLLDLDAHPPGAAVDEVSILIDPTPARIVQHTLFTRPRPTPEQLSTLVARLYALMGQERVGSPMQVDTYRPDRAAMTPFRTDQDGDDRHSAAADGAHPESSAATALRRCRPPVPVRMLVEQGRPVRVTVDRRGYDGGRIVRAAGPWRVSGDWSAAPSQPFSRQEWDIELAGGAVYRVFHDEIAGGWFLDGAFD